MLVNVGTRAARSPVEDMASLQERLGLTTKDEDFSAVWLTRDQFGMTFLDQLGLMDVSHLLELSKGFSKIDAKIFESLWFKLRTSKAPLFFPRSINTDLPKLSTSSRFAYTYIHSYLFFTRS